MYARETRRRFLRRSAPRGDSTLKRHTTPPHLAGPGGASALLSAFVAMSRRYATLASLMNGRGGVHEVDSERLVALPAVGGVERICQLTIDGTGHFDERDEHPLCDQPDDVMTPTNAFASHVEYIVPGGEVPGVVVGNRALHVLRLAPRWNNKILNDLTTRAKRKTKKGYEALERLVGGQDAGVTVSNVGGFQSTHDLLEPNTWCYTSDEEEEEEEECVDVDDGTHKNSKLKKYEILKNSNLKGWGLISAAVCLAHDRVRDPQQGERQIQNGDLYGWLNANDGGDFNKLHEHGGSNSWSGVFYVQCPKPSRPVKTKTASAFSNDSSDDSSDYNEDSDTDGLVYGLGALGLRCHEGLGEVSDETAQAENATKNKSPIPFLQFRPTVGDLLLFRGDVLHAVESNGFSRGGAKDSRDVDYDRIRLSVAFNEDSLANDMKEQEKNGG